MRMGKRQIEQRTIKGTNKIQRKTTKNTNTKQNKQVTRNFKET